MLDYYQRGGVAGGQTQVQIDLSALYQGARPAYMVAAVCDAASAVADMRYNPFSFNEGVIRSNYYGGLKNVYTLVGGRQFPRRVFDLVNTSGVGAAPDAPNTMARHRQYREFLQTTKAGYMGANKPFINFLNYCLDYSIYVFWFNAIESVDQLTLTEDVNIEFHATAFSDVALPTNLAIHTVCYVPAVLEIDAARNTSLVTRSGEQLLF